MVLLFCEIMPKASKNRICFPASRWSFARTIEAVEARSEEQEASSPLPEASKQRAAKEAQEHKNAFDSFDSNIKTPIFHLLIFLGTKPLYS